MNRRRLILSAAGFAALAAMPGTPAIARQDAMTDGGMGAAFMHIANAAKEADTLVSVTGPAAKAIEVHEMREDGGMMKMQPLKDGLEIPAEGEVELKPGGYHIMMIGLTEDLTEGTTIELTLTFKNAGDLKLEVPVINPDDAAEKAAGPATAGDITVDQAWARPAPAMAGGMGQGMSDGMGQGMDAAGTSAAYMLITNNGAEADRLTGASTLAAASAEIHEIVDDNGVMKMQPLADGLEIPAGGTVELTPGGYHVMLLGLKDDLTEGETFDLILTFEKAGDVEVTLVVVPMEDASSLPSDPKENPGITIDKAWARPAPAMAS